MRVDQQVALEVASHEALVRQTYKDSVGVNTWCVGMTNATGHTVERYIGKPASLQHCMNLYAWALTNYARPVQEVFRDKPLTQAQFAAALSFHWNTGAIRRASWVRYWLRGDEDRARKAFMNWITPKELAGRRAKERDLFFDGKWANNGTMLEYTRVTARMTPDWKSGRRINVADELTEAFRPHTREVVQDQPMQPDAIPLAPTLTPDLDMAPDDFRPVDADEPDPAQSHPTNPEPASPANPIGAKPEQPAMPPVHSPPTPIEQASKATGAAKWAGIATGLWTVVVSAGVLPPEFMSAEFTAALTGFITTAAATIGAYRAAPNAQV